jgi:hypothetical protein
MMLSAVMALKTTLWEILTVYVPTLPRPVPKAVIVVPTAIPAPEMTDPTCKIPADTAVTVSVVPEIEPVKYVPVSA